MKTPARLAAAALLLALARTARAQDVEPPAPAPAPAPDEVSRLRETVEAQQRALADLEARVTRTELHAPPPRPQPRTSEIEVGGLVHVDWVAFRQSSQNEVAPATGEPLNDNRFLIRRARIRISSDQGLVHGTFAIDANTIRGPQVRPWNVEASLKWPVTTRYRGPAEAAQQDSKDAFVIVSTGLILTPFGFDIPELQARRPFLERTTMSAELVPQSYDLGLRILGGYRFVNYAFAIMNGDPLGERAFPGRDPNESKDLVFRVGVSTEIVDGLRVDAGVSGLSGRGFHKGNAPSKDQLVWRDQNEDGQVQQTELQVLSGSPATPSQGFDRFAMGADARVHVRLPIVGELKLRAEIIRGKNLARGASAADPIGASRDLRELGWAVSATQELSQWVLLGVRHDTFDPDADAREQRPFAVVPNDRSFSTWAFMATLRWKKARLIGEYDRRRNALGRADSGAPTTLADDSFTLRLALGF